MPPLQNPPTQAYNAERGGRFPSPGTAEEEGERDLLQAIGQTATAGITPHGEDKEPVFSLDLSFGETPTQFETVNLLGAMLTPTAVFSLITSLSFMSYLDVRGNNLSAEFAWKLVKAMKKTHMQLNFVNGVDTQSIRENKTRILRMSNVHSNVHNGLYGIEVSGAIFLAHFLRVNTSIEVLCFRRNDVQKEGAKALAQAIIGNPDSKVRLVNTMAVQPSFRKGIDFCQFRTSNVQVVNLSNVMMVDDDMVFLEEWLLRFDCVVDLDLSRNLFNGEGLRKLARFVMHSQTLKKLNADGLPIDLAGIQLLATAIGSNTTLEQLTVPLGAALGMGEDKLACMAAMAEAVAKHPTLELFGVLQIKVKQIRDMKNFSSDRLLSLGTPQAEVAHYLQLMKAIHPTHMTSVSFGAAAKTRGHLYEADRFDPALLPPLCSMVSDFASMLVKLNLCLPKGSSGLVPMFQALAQSTTLSELKITGLNTCEVEVDQVNAWLGPDEHALPDLLVEKLGQVRYAVYRVGGAIVHGCRNLAQFNRLSLRAGAVPSPGVFTMALLTECCFQGIMADVDGTKVTIHAAGDADVDTMFSIVNSVQSPDLNVTFDLSDYRQTKVKEHLSHLAVALAEMGAQSRHTYTVKAAWDSIELVRCLHTAPCLKEISIDRIECLMPDIVSAMVSQGSQCKVERLNVQRHDLPTRWVQKRFTKDQVEELVALQKALVASPDFCEIIREGQAINKEKLRTMPTRQWLDLISGVVTDTHLEPKVYHPHLMVPFAEAPRGLPRHDRFLELPIDMNQPFRSLHLCMMDLRLQCDKMRADEFAATSMTLWEPRPNREEGEDRKNQLGGDGKPWARLGGGCKFHWRPEITLGSAAAVEQARFKSPTESAEGIERQSLNQLLTDCLASFFRNPSITNLDLRGNHLSKHDAHNILTCLPGNDTLRTLNGIPVMVEDALACDRLVFDGTGVNRVTGGDDAYGFEYDDPEGHAYARESLETDVLRLDEGDGYLFASLVTVNNFPSLNAISFHRHVITDHAVALICDAITKVPTLTSLTLTQTQCSTHGAALFVSCLTELAPYLTNMNGLPLSQLVEAHKSGNTGARVTLNSDVTWNEFSLGVCGRLGLFPYISWKGGAEHSGKLFLCRGAISDVGMRSLCSMLKQSSIMPMDQPIVSLDLSGNSQISDVTVLELCRAISGMQNIREINLRNCRRLHARSAFELVRLAQQDDLQIREVNGVDIFALKAAARIARSDPRNSVAPPLVVRVPANFCSDSGAWLNCLTESDAYFFAQLLHIFPTIAYCHLHIELPPTKDCEDKAHRTLNTDEDAVRRALSRCGETAGGILDGVPAEPWGGEGKAPIEAVLGSAQRFFETCPASTKMQLSISPYVPCIHGVKENGAPSAMLHRLRNRLIARKKRKQPVKEGTEEQAEQDKTPAGPSYVNNISSQRSHDHFYSIYGQDDTELFHDDIYDGKNPKYRVFLPADVKLLPLTGICSSLDIQHLDISARHLAPGKNAHIPDVTLLTHINLNHNRLADAGVKELFSALAQAASMVIHVAVSDNMVGDEGAVSISHYLHALPRIASLNLSHNCITETGSIALAETVGGNLMAALPGHHEGPKHSHPLHIQSMDLTGNYVRELGSMRWAEVVAVHAQIQFLSLAENMIGHKDDDAFLALAYAASASQSITVMDLTRNFSSSECKTEGPPDRVLDKVKAALPPAEFDGVHLQDGLFIRRGLSATDKK